MTQKTTQRLVPVLTLRTVVIRDGIVKLSPSQALPRERSLKARGNTGIYEVVSPIQFKAGEVLSVDQIPKGMESDFEVDQSKEWAI